MEIIYKKVDELIPYVNNSRTHSEDQIIQICSSIKEFGFTNPILIDENGGIIAGHGRLLASKKLNMKEVPCIILKGLTEAQKKAYIIADNKIALNAGWDEDLLELELENLKELDFDLELTGFSDEEIDNILSKMLEDNTEEKAEEKEENEIDPQSYIYVGSVSAFGDNGDTILYCEFGKELATKILTIEKEKGAEYINNKIIGVLNDL